tara:strand:- start:1978 stop:2907 length:930 start_codon:yes stop_codon:yes gene_type:complete
MESKQLGKTDIMVPIYSIGTSPFGNMYGETNLKELQNIVVKAIDNGINYFDTSPYYGLKRSEINLGKCLKGIPRHDYYISTKVGRYADDIFDFSETTIIKSLDSSLERLGINYVDILLAHDVEFGDIDQIINETLPAMQKLKDSGKVRYIGFSCYPIKLIRKIINRSSIKIDVVLSYGHGCIINNTINTITPYLKLKGIGIINASPLCMGLISTNTPPKWHPAPYKMIEDIREVGVSFKNKFDYNIESFAIACVPEMYPDIETTLIGIKNMQELDNLIEIFEKKRLIPNEYYGYVSSRVEHIFNYSLHS